MRDKIKIQRTTTILSDGSKVYSVGIYRGNQHFDIDCISLQKANQLMEQLQNCLINSTLYDNVGDYIIVG